MEKKSKEKDLVPTRELVKKAKEDWLETFTGPCLKVEADLGHAITQRFHKRYFDTASRTGHFVSIFARAMLGNEAVKEPEDIIHKKLASVLLFFDNQIAAAKAVMADAGIAEDQKATYMRPEHASVKIVSRSAGELWKVIKRADEYLLYLNTLWLHGEIDETNRSKKELELKTNLRRSALSIVNVYLGLRRQYDKRSKEGTIGEGAAEAKAEAGKIAADASNAPEAQVVHDDDPIVVVDAAEAPAPELVAQAA